MDFVQYSLAFFNTMVALFIWFELSDMKNIMKKATKNEDE